MKKIIWVLLVLGCKMPLRDVEERLGPGAVCTYTSNDEDNHQVSCVYNGSRYHCITRHGNIACALVSTNPAEVK